MSLPAIDDFARGVAANLGANWTVIDGDARTNVGNNAAHFGGSWGYFYWNADVFPNDHSGRVTVENLGGFSGVGARFSGTTGAGNGYYALVNGAGNSRLSKVVAGSVTDLIGSGSLPDPATNDAVLVTAQGTNIKVFYTFVEKASVTDGSIASGSAGMAFFSTGAEVDDFYAESLAATAGYLLVKN